MTTDPAGIAWIADRLAGALIALDFDGTLAPLVRDPQNSRPVPGVVDTLAALATAGARVAIVTGRDALTVLELGALHDIGGLRVSGLHGAETWSRTGLQTRDEPAGLAALREELPARLPDGVWIEDKRLSLVLHARRAPEPDQALAALADWLPALAAEHGLEVHPGKLVAEIRIPGLSKATAVEQLLGTDTTAALYAGDDLGDLPAVEAITGWRARTGRPALTVAVGALSELRAVTDHAVPGPAELAQLLSRLLPPGPQAPAGHA